MAYYQFSKHFDAFFKRLNPSPTFGTKASSEYASIKGLIEDRRGLAAGLAPECFLQGSYKQSTAIYTINDIDIIALCQLWQPGDGGGGGRTYGRHEIFDTIAAPLLADHRYRDKVYYTQTSMCIKVDLGIKVEILPVVFRSGNSDAWNEPFRLWRPERGQWEDGFARYHQAHLSIKNADDRTGGNFIPAIKVMKHIRSLFGLDAVSFHIECLLYSMPDSVFCGSPAEYIPRMLQHIAKAVDGWAADPCKTPCDDRYVFIADEWSEPSWRRFHDLIGTLATVAGAAAAFSDYAMALDYWQTVLGKDYFPATAT